LPRPPPRRPPSSRPEARRPARRPSRVHVSVLDAGKAIGGANRDIELVIATDKVGDVPELDYQATLCGRPFGQGGTRRRGQPWPARPAACPQPTACPSASPRWRSPLACSASESRSRCGSPRPPRTGRSWPSPSGQQPSTVGAADATIPLLHPHMDSGGTAIGKAAAMERSRRGCPDRRGTLVAVQGDQAAASSLVGVTAVIVASRAARSAGRCR
jgi:hypothetical protein